MCIMDRLYIPQTFKIAQFVPYQEFNKALKNLILGYVLKPCVDKKIHAKNSDIKML